jgi:hypothetical protein
MFNGCTLFVMNSDLALVPHWDENIRNKDLGN